MGALRRFHLHNDRLPRTALRSILRDDQAQYFEDLAFTRILPIRGATQTLATRAAMSTVRRFDFSENAAVVQPFAVELAREAGAKILLVHVVEDSVYYASAAAGEGIGVDVEAWLTTICAEAEKRLHTEAAALSAKSGLEVVPIMSRGRAAERLVELATEHHADLMVISTHGYTGLSHLIFGSVAERIVRISHVPVLSIKPQKVAEHAQSMLS